MNFPIISEIIFLMNSIISDNNVDENNKYFSIAKDSLIFIQKEIDKLEQQDEFETKVLDKSEDYIFNESDIDLKESHNCYDYNKILQISDYMKSHPGHKFQTIRTKFKKLSQTLFYKIKKFNDSNNTVGFENSKIKIIREKMFKKFNEFRGKFVKVSDKCLKFWAIKIAREINFPKFRAGTYFIYKFKKDFGISGRKITKFVAKKYLQNETEIQQKVRDFREDLKNNILPNFNQDYILNADQTNMKYEMCPKRTLALKGQRNILVKIQNKNSTTHSYTLMPTISMNGKCFGELNFLTRSFNIEFLKIINFLINHILYLTMYLKMYVFPKFNLRSYNFLKCERMYNNQGKLLIRKMNELDFEK